MSADGAVLTTPVALTFAEASALAFLVRQRRQANCGLLMETELLVGAEAKLRAAMAQLLDQAAEV